MSKRARTERREREREAVRLLRARMKLASLEVGGDPQRPIEVTSASVVEVHAASLPCAACGGSNVRVDEHTVETVEPPRASPDPASLGGRTLRAAHVRCARCSAKRVIWFRIGTPLPS